VLQFVANGLCDGSVYALVALGFGLIYTTSRVFHIAHGAIYTLGAYLLYSLLICQKWPPALALLAATLGAALSGALVELLVYRPLDRQQAPPAVLMISSLGVYIVLVNLIILFFGNERKILRTGNDETIHLGEVILTRAQIAQVLGAILLGCLYWMFLRKTSLGKVCRALADDPLLASVLGIGVERTRLVVFAVGSFLAATGGCLAAMDVGVDPVGGFAAVLVAAVACIVGGVRSFVAPALGGGAAWADPRPGSLANFSEVGKRRHVWHIGWLSAPSAAGIVG